MNEGHSSTDNPRTGFTLVELLAALAISSLLLVCVMGLSVRLAQGAKAVREQHSKSPWLDVLQHRLQTDYQNARSVVIRPSEITIEGKGTLADAKSNDGFLMQLPMRISYTISNFEDDIYVLVRTERSLVNVGQGGVQSELLATGLTGFQSDQILATDVAPGVLGLQIFKLNEAEPIQLNLIRHGVAE